MIGEQLNDKQVKFSMHEAIDWVRQERNSVVKTYLDNAVVQEYVGKKFGVHLSHIKMEFVNRDLHEMLISPVDLVHYSAILTELTHSPGESFQSRTNGLIMVELDKTLQKYAF
ncbi:hypothetical protein [Chryseolinea lacunae]|uniref:Uncharacterized protein n=1 Tax=Chryseolinea lacunae TaxID=2801331 RepID=A0ABS1L281_9BACT|nr:hypothetical protein [Chryseolinea lacunae]MBL0745816.1 hypothetical protein [Chryseolinea lacunae]